MQRSICKTAVLGFLLGTVSACSISSDPSEQLDATAGEYVALVLALGEHDPDYVDYYYGAPELRDSVRQSAPTLEAIEQDARRVLAELDRLEVSGPELVQLRHRYLSRQLESLLARTRMLQGANFSFDRESQALYDAAAPVNSEEHFQEVLQQLEELLPGAGPIHQRYREFRSGFVIPPDRVDAVFRRAVEECRERTARWVELPEAESFEIEYVTGKSWSGYNWYQGNFHSLIQVNLDLPIYLDRAVDLACHEGYPGHHVYNVLLEGRLVRDRGWIEYSVYPLFSPQSLIAEGSANYGIQMAFPGDERLEFEREILSPLAGLDPREAERYYQVMDRVERLGYAGNEAARAYLDGDMERASAQRWLEDYALMSPERARQRVDFIEQYRSYVINYNLGEDLVRDYVERGTGTETSEATRWERFTELLASPHLPSDLK